MAHKRPRTCQHWRVPSYVQAMIALAVATLLMATVLPAPRLHPVRLGALCLSLMVGAAATFAVALVVMVLGMCGVLSGPVVIAPAIAGLAMSVVLCMTMCWVVSAAQPQPEAVAADEESGEDDGGGGGGGLRPEDEPPRDPGPPDGICWDSFDRDRRAWEDAGPARTPERELVEA
jgi:hypothetical protein